VNYIKKIQLVNFQSHKNSILELAPPGQLTVIVGPSDNGKTATIRGVKLLATNNPTGTDYIRIGENETQVSADMADDTKVTRQRTRGGVNRYLLAPEGRAKQTFESFGTGVPLEIQQALEISPINIGDMTFNLNLSEQLDGPFLGNSVPVTAKAKVLGKLSGVEEVDHANKTLGTDIYRERREKEAAENQVQHLTKQIEAYGYLDELGPMIEAVEKHVVGLKAKLEKRKALMDLKIKLNATRAAIQLEQQKIDELKVVDVIEPILVKVEKDIVLQSRLTTLQVGIQTTREGIKQSDKILQDTKDVDVIYSIHIRVVENITKQSQLITLQAAIQLTREDLEQVKKVMQDTRDIDVVDGLLSGVSAKVTKLRRLRELQVSLKSIKEAKANTVTALESLKDVDKAEDLLNRIITNNERCMALRRLQISSEVLKAEKEQNRKTLDDTKDVNVITQKIEDVATKLERRNKLASLWSMKYNTRQEIIKAEAAILDIKVKEQAAIETYRMTLQEAGTCPTCGSKLDPEKIIKEAV
jgi:exonuclease SbcC